MTTSIPLIAKRNGGSNSGRGPADGREAAGAPQGVAGEVQPPHVVVHDGDGVPRECRRRDIHDAER